MGSVRRSRQVVPSQGPAWRGRAACRPDEGHDPALWFPRETPEWATREEQRAAQRVRHEMTEQARAICMTCEVRAECGQYASDTNETEGIWGGHTPSERGVTPLR